MSLTDKHHLSHLDCSYYKFLGFPLISYFQGREETFLCDICINIYFFFSFQNFTAEKKKRMTGRTDSFTSKEHCFT